MDNNIADNNITGSLSIQVDIENLFFSTDLESHNYNRVSSTSSLFKEPYLLEASLVIDVSENKKWIAYITSDQYLVIRQLPVISEENKTGTLAFADKDIQNCFHQEVQACYFLSVSSDGMRAALSFLAPNRNKTCYIFEKDTEGGKIVKIKELKFEGRAVFLKGGNLALLNFKAIEIYDCQQNYKKIQWFGIDYDSHVFWSTAYDERVSTQWVNAAWCSKYNDASELIIKISKHMEQNILTTSNERIIRAWSITDDGARITSFRGAISEEILAFSPDCTLFATVTRTKNSISIYTIKYDVANSHLQLCLSDTINNTLEKNKENNKYCTNYASFSKNNQYLLTISIGKLKPEYIDEHNALIIFQVWNIYAEKSIYQGVEHIQISWEDDSDKRPAKLVQPFVIESGIDNLKAEDLPKFTVFYSVLTKENACELKQKSIRIYKDTHPLAENTEETQTKLSNQNWAIPKEPSFDDTNTSDKPIYLEQRTASYIYILRFDQSTVQLWRRINDSGQQKKHFINDELVYIKTFGFGFDLCSREASTQAHIAPLQSRNLLGIKFMKCDSEGVVLVAIRGKLGKSAEDEIYLPLDHLNRNSNKFQQEYHYMESACKALVFWSIVKDFGTLFCNEEFMEAGFKKTLNIIKKSIYAMKRTKSKFFTTISGSNVLAMLAGIPEGQSLLFDILKTRELAVNIFNFEQGQNAFTVLIDKKKYNLYSLLFNRVLLHSQKRGTGSFSALTDTIIHLQESGNSDLLFTSCQNLSYLQIEQEASTVAKSEGKDLQLSVLHKSTEPDFKDLRSNSTQEQIKNYYNHWFLEGWIYHVAYWWHVYIGYTLRVYCYRKKPNFTMKFFPSSSNTQSSELYSRIICIVPLQHFSSYNCHGDEDISSREIDGPNFFSRWLTRRAQALGILYKPGESNISKVLYKRSSTFLKLATNQHENDIFFQGDTAVSIFLYYKWKTFARKKFVLILSIHLIFYICYSVGILFSRNVFNYVVGVPITDKGHLACIILMFISGGILFIQEIRQFLRSPTAYFLSPYNAIDLIALIAPAISFWQITNNIAGIDEFGSICTLLLWLHGILRLRVISSVGITLETIFQLVNAVYRVLFLMLLVIVAFTQAFMVLLSQREDSYFQEKYEGSVDLSNSGLSFSADNAADYSDASTNNNFNNPFKSFSMLWFFIYGVWDPINDGDVGDNYMVMALAILFSFITVLLFFNLIIALMSSKAEEVKQRGKKVWISHFASVIAEIEQLWCTKKERHSSINNPSLIHYVARLKDVLKQEEKLFEETESLIQKIQLREDEVNQTSELISILKEFDASIEGADMSNREELNVYLDQIKLKINK